MWSTSDRSDDARLNALRRRREEMRAHERANAHQRAEAFDDAVRDARGGFLVRLRRRHDGRRRKVREFTEQVPEREAEREAGVGSRSGSGSGRPMMTRFDADADADEGQDTKTIEVSAQRNRIKKEQRTDDVSTVSGATARRMTNDGERARDERSPVRARASAATVDSFTSIPSTIAYKRGAASVRETLIHSSDRTRARAREWETSIDRAREDSALAASVADMVRRAETLRAAVSPLRF